MLHLRPWCSTQPAVPPDVRPIIFHFVAQSSSSCPAEHTQACFSRWCPSVKYSIKVSQPCTVQACCSGSAVFCPHLLHAVTFWIQAKSCLDVAKYSARWCLCSIFHSSPSTIFPITPGNMSGANNVTRSLCRVTHRHKAAFPSVPPGGRTFVVWQSPVLLYGFLNSSHHGTHRICHFLDQGFGAIPPNLAHRPTRK